MGSFNLNSALGMAGGLTGIAQTAVDAAQIKNTEEEEGVIRGLKTTNFDLGDYSSIESLWNATDFAKTNYTMKDVRG